MLISNNSVACDICNLELVDDFTYYSLDFDKIKIQNNNIQPIHRNINSIDLCGLCLDPIKSKIVTNFDALVKGKRHKIIYCELSGEKLYDHTAYKCRVSEVVAILSKSITKHDKNYVEFILSEEQYQIIVNRVKPYAIQPIRSVVDNNKR